VRPLKVAGAVDTSGWTHGLTPSRDKPGRTVITMSSGRSLPSNTIPTHRPPHRADHTL